MRIAHVTATFPPYHGGTGNTCFHNARELARRGHEVHVFSAALTGAPAHELHEGFTVHRLRPLVRVGNAPVLPGLLWTLRCFDVIHLHYPFFGGEITALAAGVNQTPLVITYHQDVFLEGVMGLIERTLRWTTGRLTLRAARRLLFTSLDYRNASYVRPMLRGRERTIGELPNGVDVAHFHPGSSPTDLRLRHQLAQEDQIALVVASLDRAHSFKGVNIFLAALAQLPAAVKGVIVGDGDLRVTYETSAEELGVGSRVVFAGRVSDEELPRYYNLADVTVLPSVTMGEAFGLVLVESMASGTPVVATHLPGVRTVVDHGRDGLLVEPGDSTALAGAMRWILNHNADCLVMGQRGRRKVEERYTWERIGAQLEAMYADLVAEQCNDGKRRGT
jgi:glycosyltransferase involved in cell wall biosynthesis